PVALLLIASRPSDSDGLSAPAARLLKHLDADDTVSRLDLEALPPASVPPTSAAWARYALALADPAAALPAALRGAAELLEDGDTDAASDLIAACLGPQDNPDAPHPAPHPVLRRLLRRFGRPDTPDNGDLTAREHEVLSCLARGMSNRQVAKALGISVRTVTVHVSNLLRKTGTTSRTEAALWAVERGLAGQPPR
ncbi:MAG TPA: helix-turn-helix transcriptional regulator, partial [Stackebrandtia sp.]|uniref:helix-turn-helix transcriptional regulator n=1 Tax=Stackebrandtia sp. TaxID=2023065 RepID=UPI002D75AE73